MDVSFEQIASNLNSTTINGVRIWFSYATPVAVYVPGKGTTVHQNIWSVTTAKHLSKIDGGSKEAKAERVDSETFKGIMRDALAAASAS